MNPAPVNPALVLALTGLRGEGELVRSLTGAQAPARISRRVTDVVGLLAACEAGLAEGVLVAARFPGLDAGVLQQLRDRGLPCWGIVDAGDDDGHQLLTDRGLPVAVLGSHPAATVRTLLAEPAPTSGSAAPAGPLIVVTGPAGAPGRSTVALSLAAECPAALLVDADMAAPSLAFQLDLDPGAASILAVQRAAQRGALDARALVAAAQPAGGGLRVVTGVAAPARVAELDGLGGGASFWTLARGAGAPVIVDAGAFPPPAGTGLLQAGALAAATAVVVVAEPSALGIRRLVSGYPDLAAQIGGPITLVWNRLVTGRGGTLGRRPLERLRPVNDALGPAAVAGLPQDSDAAAALDGRGGSLRDRAPRSALRAAIRTLAADLLAPSMPRDMPPGPG